MADEGVLFEGLRLGSLQAFTELLRADDAAMRRLAGLYVPAEEVGPLLRRAWAVALPGLDMFTWHTTLRAWLTGILVSYGRAAAPPGPGPALTPGSSPVAPGGPGAPAPPAGTGRLPWASLGWSALWPPDGWAVLEDALAARPLPEREVLWLHDVEGWSWREVLDTLALTAEQGDQLRRRGRTALADRVAEHLGATPAPGEEEQRLAGVAGLLSALRPVGPPPPADPRLVQVFTAWRRHRRVRVWRRWWWELRRRRSAGQPG